MADTETDAGLAAGFHPGQLEGFRIGVTSDRRSEDLIAAFERRGAEVLHAPAIRIAAVDDDAELTRDTAAIIAARPDLLLATTSYGMRRWLEVADAAGLGAELTAVLERARILVRGPKARGAVRAAGLEDSGMSIDEIIEYLSARDGVLIQQPRPGDGTPIPIRSRGNSWVPR